MSIETILRRQPVALVAGVCVVTLGLAVVADRTSAHEIGLEVLYLVPVAIAGWSFDRWWGVAFAVASAVAWLVVDLSGRDPFWDPFVSVWNGTSRLLLFALVAWLLASLRREGRLARALTRIDPLTGVGNANAFYERVDWEIEMVRRRPRPLTVAFMDVETEGPDGTPGGGTVTRASLDAVTDAVGDVIRSTDLLARVDDEQFAVVFPETDRMDSAAVLLKISEKVLAATRDSDRPVSLRVGAVTFTRAPESAAELRRIADDVMRAARDRGAGVIEHQVVGT